MCPLVSSARGHPHALDYACALGIGNCKTDK
jgi:hypothetical protein